MASIGKGTKVKFTLAVSGLGEKKLTDNDVDFKLDFYAKERATSKVTAFCVVRKEDATPDASDTSGNTYFVICDTTNLDLGTINATLRVEYTDEDTNAPLVEIIALTSDVVIINAPASEEEVEAEVEEAGE